MTKEEKQNMLAEDILHSLIRAGSIDECAITGATDHRTVNGTIDLAIEMAHKFTLAIAERRRRLLDGANLTEEETREILNGRPIHAIQLVRQRTGLSLKGGKRIVDEAKARLREGIMLDGESPDEHKEEIPDLANPFSLYYPDSASDVEPFKKATEALNEALKEGFEKYPGDVEAVYDFVYCVAEEFEELGATDTMSRDVLYRMISERAVEGS